MGLGKTLVSGELAGLGASPSVEQIGLKLLSWQRLAEQKTLVGAAAVVLQNLPTDLGLDALDHNFQPELGGQADDGAQQRLRKRPPGFGPATSLDTWPRLSLTSLKLSSSRKTR